MVFYPLPQTIENITKANPAVVTTESNHNLTTGQVIRLNIPKQYGMQELDHQIAIITIISDTMFSLQKTQVPPAVDIDSRQFQSFTNVGTGTPPQIIPIGAGPTPQLNTFSQRINNTCASELDDALTNISTTEIPF